MFKRVAVYSVCTVALSAALLNAQDVFVLPGAGTQNGLAQAFVTNPLTSFRTFNTTTGSFAVLPNADASKYFFVGTGPSNNIVALDGSLLTSTSIASLPATASQALVTPDGKLDRKSTRL